MVRKGARSRRGGAKTRQERGRFIRIVQILGFRSLVEEARKLLLSSLPDKDPPGDLGWSDGFAPAVWTIMDLCSLQAQDEPFVMNAVRFGIDKALETKITPPTRILIPELPRRFFPALSIFLAEVLWPQDSNEKWLDVTESGNPAGVWVSRPGKLTGDEYPTTAPVTVIRGQGVLALLARTREPRILLDVTNATTGDVRRAMSEVTKLRRQLRASSYAVKRGAGTSIDEAKAIDAARRYEEGETIVDIAKHHGWSISYDDFRGSSPITVDYIRKGSEIVNKLGVFKAEMDVIQN